MEKRLQNIRDSLQDSLDELSSTRSSSEAKTRALQRIERHLASACISQDSSEDLFSFNALQYTFECNVPLRLLAWISVSTHTLEVLTNKGSTDPADRELQASTLSNQLALSLSLIQGVSLNHAASKAYLGRKYALEASASCIDQNIHTNERAGQVLIDLLLASRHVSNPTPLPTDTPSRTTAPQPQPLSSMILDTLLCILVDAPGALRAFEEASGTQAIVKILKRAGTPREVRTGDTSEAFEALSQQQALTSIIIITIWVVRVFVYVKGLILVKHTKVYVGQFIELVFVDIIDGLGVHGTLLTIIFPRQIVFITPPTKNTSGFTTYCFQTLTATSATLLDDATKRG
ncbi:hypothetical protein H0H87_008146 [Tephrocybe sp. NHM501043]|nr:hypothetical protein H0H87_008146 [Tephrocybe sp. NHM501043]